ncbi:MAG: PQQ-binding-like beta-propeller repeat protein [Euryarchaeota archaeon]|nr:PQQ-binding-like beta-propeller repeat protein [Euryarchaeota archaeon]
MHTTHSMNLSITGGIIMILVIGFIVPSTVAIAKTYPDDGVWEDTFEDSTNLKLTGCNFVNGTIELKKGTSHFTYNFADTLSHYAYAYQAFLFLPIGKTFSPTSHLSKEAIFEGNDINKIKRLDQLSATRSATYLKRFVIQHFRFKPNSAAEVIDNIVVSWYGKATNKAIVNYYFWNSSKFINGAWQKLGRNISQGNNITFSHMITQGDLKYALDANNYIDICVVASLKFIHLSTLCNLSTNYIKLYSTGEQGYALGYGFAETKNPIDPLSISTHFSGFYWDTLTWNDYQSGGAAIKYQILYEKNSGNYILVPNDYFTDNPEGKNSDGFSHPPVYLNAIPYKKLKIRANLTTDTPLTSPRIFSWAMTWQNSSQWLDLFSTSYRIDVENKVHIGSNIVNISRIQGEWPMVGFNPENNRATTGDGPSTSSLYWYGNEYVGGQFRNPVIGNGKVYIVSNARTIYQYNMELPAGVGSGNPQTRTSFHSFDYDIVNSPAVTDDYIVVATGQMDTGGHINHIYALPRDNISKTWVYDFSNNDTAICYFSSPVIAGDNVFITSWGGDNGVYVLESNRYTNNKILAVDLQNPKRTWQEELSAPSFSSPAASLSHDIVIAGCNSPDNNSVFAFSLNGSKLWSKKIGAVGYASPVIYGNTVFVTATITSSLSIKTMMYALNLTDGKILWNKTICSSDKAYSSNGDSTPAIFDNILYVASPNGTLFALNASGGSELWATSVYNRSHLFSPSSLTSSPVYADGKVYLGLPSKKIIARIATTGAEAWGFDTFQTPDFKRSPVFGSPIVSNGLLFVADENGDLYSIGTYKAPSQQIQGSITSIPIKLPESFWWYRFYAYAVYDKTISGITFKLLDEDNNVLKNLQNGTLLPMSDVTLPRTLRLRADFTTQNISANNPSLLRWGITLTQDSVPPYLYPSITPTFNGWLNIVVPRISIKVKDNGTGLLVNSAQYTLQYILNNITYMNTYFARCTGTNGTTQVQNITANLSAIPDYDNITSLKSITFSIKDLAGNTVTKYFKIKQDITDPSSYVKKQSMKPRYDASANFIWINASSFDNETDASGIKQVKLYYRYSSTGNFTGDWVYFTNSTQKSPHWKFNFTSSSSQHGGYFEVCTVAIDNASNIEEFPIHGDVSFLYDWKIPDLPSFSGNTLWFKERLTYSVLFEDDFRLDTIQYRPNFETSWTTIATDVNASTYDKSWSLKEEYWDQMNEGELYYLYFKINDTLGNTLLVTSNNQAITFRKDTSVPIGTIDIPTLETEMSWSYNFTVSGLVNDQDGSGIKEVSLYYRFSEDKSNWSRWTVYGDPLDSSPFEWEYTAAEGDGYYEFKINVTDIAGNNAESEVFPVVVTSFPTTLTLVMIGLVIVLSLISAVIFIKWRKRK